MRGLTVVSIVDFLVRKSVFHVVFPRPDLIGAEALERCRELIRTDEELLNKMLHADLRDFNFHFYCEVAFGTDLSYRLKQLKKFCSPQSINEDNVIKIQFESQENIVTERDILTRFLLENGVHDSNSPVVRVDQLDNIQRIKLMKNF